MNAETLRTEKPAPVPRERSRGPRHREGMGILAKHRFENGWTTKEVAARAGVERMVISALESGNSKRLLRTNAKLPAIAKAYGLPLEQMLIFAKPERGTQESAATRVLNGAPKRAADAKRVGKFGGIPDKPRMRGGKVPSGLGGVRYHLGFTKQQMADRCGVSLGTISKVEAHEPTDPKSHDVIAKEYGVSVAELAAGKVKAAAPGKSIVVAKQAPLIKAAKASPVRAYNTLRGVSVPVRQFVRTLATQVNIEAMKGNRYVTLPPLPTAMVADFLTDYMLAHGIKRPMLLDPEWADMFDKK